MGHVTYMAHRRPSVTIFGAAMQVLAKRDEDCDCGALRAENEELRRNLNEAIKGQTAIALRLAEYMEREPALVAAVERAESATRYAEGSLRIAEAHIADLKAEVEICRKGIAT